ncbi:hypothetical protein L2E82_05849 [Cichorium intybus]|uniref:Uncharacterized protein n=1 Tax=Cichorium intybus TaxID=13427 RepID=A0ACB9H9R4_CICIN|nr:hypothetical protein L2E82_05849 [Cichorium intybus]
MWGKKKISPAAARSCFRITLLSNPKNDGFQRTRIIVLLITITGFEYIVLYLGIVNKILLVFFVGFSAWAYQTALPPPPTTVGSPDGPPITSPRIKLRDGRHLSYIESVKELGVYFVAIDRPGYGESDPDPKRTVKSLAFDIEELADQLAGAVLIAPGINYWWPNLPLNSFSRQLPQDQWSMRIAHHLPWLSYWWNTQKWFPSFSVIDEIRAVLSPSDIAVSSKLFAAMSPDQVLPLDHTFSSL